MGEIIFTCRTITPLVLTGADGKTPELRPPSIKASLRFWWRALNGHLSLKELRKIEGDIFGNNNRRSNLIIRVSANEQLRTGKVALLPHKTEEKQKSLTDAFSENQEFKVVINYFEKKICEDDNQIDLNQNYVKNLFVIACTLGGWGKRSRRGLGSIEITEIDGEGFSMPIIANELFNNYFQNLIRDRFTLNGNRIDSKPIKKNNSEEYPRILSVEISQGEKSLTNISSATHQVKNSNPQEYSLSVGDGRPRFASPIYVSTLRNGHSIITTLKKQSNVYTDIQDQLKNLILR